MDAGTGAGSGPIDRSAASSAKGPRLQRLRAGLFLLHAITDERNIHAYVAVEAEGDVVVKEATDSETHVYSEEDKNFNEEGAFTFVSPSVINSMVIFVDQWIGWQQSAKVKFGLYTTVNVGKEKTTERIKTLGLTFPLKPMIELLRLRDYSDAQLLICVKALIVAEYTAQYKQHPGRGFLNLISAWDDATWLLFLSRIDWLFCQEDEQGVLRLLHDAVRACPHYRQCHEGREDVVASALLDLLDERQLAGDHAERFVHASDVALIFRKVEHGELRRVDPTWQKWDELGKPTDVRNIGDKFRDACPAIASITLGRYQRHTSAGHLELEAHGQDKSVIALMYQVYDACEASLAGLASRSDVLTERQLAEELGRLVDVAVDRVKQRTSDYDYVVKNTPFLRNLVLTLFDSCYLSLGQPRSVPTTSDESDKDGQGDAT